MLEYIEGSMMKAIEKTPYLVKSQAVMMGKFALHTEGWFHHETYESEWKMENFHLLKKKAEFFKD